MAHVHAVPVECVEKSRIGRAKFNKYVFITTYKIYNQTGIPEVKMLFLKQNIMKWAFNLCYGH